MKLWYFRQLGVTGSVACAGAAQRTVWCGTQEGHVRFEKEGEAAKAAAKLAENKTELGGKVPAVVVLEGRAFPARSA